MSVLLGIVAPVFALIGMGALAISRRMITPEAVHGMTGFVFYAAIPGLLFASVAEAPPLRLLDVAGSFLGGGLILFAVALGLAYLLLGARLAAAAVFALNCVYGNNVLLGIPIVAAAYGREGVTCLLAVIAFQTAVILPLATLVVEAGCAHGRGSLAVLGAALRGLLYNPVVVSILLAFAWRGSGIAMPEPLHRFLALTGAAGPPLALFCLGATLPRPAGWSGLREVALATAIKLVAMPALVALIAGLAGVRGLAFSVAVLAAALPTGANAFLLARRFETMMEASASTMVITTALAVITLTLLLSWLPR